MSRAILVPLFLFLSLLYLNSLTAHAIECSKFKAEGDYNIHNDTFKLVFLGCDSAVLTHEALGIQYDFILDGKTHSKLPKSLYDYRKARKDIPDLSILEKFEYVSKLDIDDDGGAVHLNLTAVVRPKNSKGISKIHLKGHAAIYLRSKKSRNDCADCKNQNLFQKNIFLQLWLGNVEITKVEGGTKKDAEEIIFGEISKDYPYRSFIALEDKNKKPYHLDELILVENFMKLDSSITAPDPTPTPTPSPSNQPYRR